MHPELVAAAEQSPLALADALEQLVATGQAGEGERRYAYEQIRDRPVTSAADALARAQIIGRLAQREGLAARGLISEMEKAARHSRELDPDLRDGAAQRLLGSLYVRAPARLLEHGDSETGLELLEELAERYPQDLQTRLRVAEAYVALSDPEPAFEHLCFVLPHRAKLRRDHAALLDDLVQNAELNPQTDCNDGGP